MEKISKKILKEQYKNRSVVGGIYSIKCSINNAMWLRAATDMQGARNRFTFAVKIDSCPEPCMLEAWKTYGGTTFSFEILEEMQKKETQTEKEFSEDINTLMEMWSEK